MTNGLSFDVEDWFQVENLRSACPRNKWDSFESRIERNMDVILDLLAKNEVKATFFVLGWIAERYPDLVRRISAEGHEIASHGYNHELVYNLTPEEFKADVVRSKKMLEDISGQEIIGYRAPSFSITDKSIWAIDVLKETGYQYDSSIFPTSFHDRYGFSEIKDSRCFTHTNGLREIPLTVYPLLDLCLPLAGGGYFRLCPFFIFRFLLAKLNSKKTPFIFYLHPWELDVKQPRVKVCLQHQLRHYLNIDKTVKKLNRIIRRFKFQPLNQFIDF